MTDSNPNTDLATLRFNDKADVWELSVNSADPPKRIQLPGFVDWKNDDDFAKVNAILQSWGYTFDQQTWWDENGTRFVLVQQHRS